MQVERREIESNLVKKGFIKETNGDHRCFHHEYKGKRTGVSTYVSHGSKHKSYGISLIKEMKKQLRLDTIKDALNLLKCPMKEDQYNRILIDKNVFPDK